VSCQSFLLAFEPSLSLRTWLVLYQEVEDTQGALQAAAAAIIFLGRSDSFLCDPKICSLVIPTRKCPEYPSPDDDVIVEESQLEASATPKRRDSSLIPRPITDTDADSRGGEDDNSTGKHIGIVHCDQV
jgi:hypothetical protein